MSDSVLFTLEDVWKESPGENGGVRVVLREVSAWIPGRGITCLVGASGSGKSTFLRLLNRLEDPTQGRIAFRGRDLRAWNPTDLRRRIGLVFQNPVMLPGTVRDNLEAGPRLRGQALDDPASLSDRVGLGREVLDRDARELSGGEKQRVALARTLAVGPEVLLLDEIAASLDAESAAGVERLVMDLGLPSIWVSHDLNQVKRVATRVFRLEAGRFEEATL